MNVSKHCRMVFGVAGMSNSKVPLLPTTFVKGVTGQSVDNKKIIIRVSFIYNKKNRRKMNRNH
jgi:hypothetical protein